MRQIFQQIKKDPVVIIAFFLALISCGLVPPSRVYFSYFDWRVLGLLLSLMLVIAGLRQSGLFAVLVRQLVTACHDTRRLSAILVFLCFLGSMVLTNDVALLTFVPFAILALSAAGYSNGLIPVMVLQTIAANLGSMLTPLGNPQNLFLYSRFDLHLTEFLAITAVPTLLSLLLLLFCLHRWIPNEPLQPVTYTAATLSKKDLLLFLFLFLLCLLAVCRLLSWLPVLVIVVLFCLISRRSLLAKADYVLLLTFLFFFLFVGNLQQLSLLQETLSPWMNGREFHVAVLLSQVISNVPAAVLLSGFTEQVKPLLLGVNIGGLGTPIASMASLISYRLYAATIGAKKKKYLLVFTLLNLFFLLILWPVCALIFQ